MIKSLPELIDDAEWLISIYPEKTFNVRYEWILEEVE